jgi:hypothetical protein
LCDGPVHPVRLYREMGYQEGTAAAAVIIIIIIIIIITANCA